MHVIEHDLCIVNAYIHAYACVRALSSKRWHALFDFLCICVCFPTYLCICVCTFTYIRVVYCSDGRLPARFQAKACHRNTGEPGRMLNLPSRLAPNKVAKR